MDTVKNTCRLCLKITSDESLTPLFDVYGYEFRENVAMEWRRMFSFIYNIQGLPDKICGNCKTQAEWILNFHRQCYDNDAILRLKQMKTKDLELPEQYFNTYQDEENGLDNDGQMLELEYNPEVFDENEDQMTIDDSKNIFIEEIPSNLVEQEHFVEATDYETIQSKDETKICKDQSKEEHEQHDQMDYSTESISSYDNSKDSDHSVMPGRSSVIKSSGYNCPICGKSFANTSSLNVHRTKHGNPKPFVCTFLGCEKKYSKKVTRDDHIKSIHENITYKCPACNHTRKYRCDIAKHICKDHRGTGLQPIELEG